MDDTALRERYHELMTGEFKSIYDEELAAVKAGAALPGARPVEIGACARTTPPKPLGAKKYSAAERKILADRAARGESVALI